MNNKVNIEELALIIKSARKYSLLGEYGNSLEKYQEAVSLIKQRQEEIKNENDSIKEKWKMTEYNIKSEMLQIKDILQICLQLHHSEFSYNKKQNEGNYFFNESKKIIDKEVNDMYNKDKKAYELNKKNNNNKYSYSESNKQQIKQKIKSKSSNMNNNYISDIKKNKKQNKINPFLSNQGYKSNYNSNSGKKNYTNIKKSRSLKEPTEIKMFNPLEEFCGHDLKEKDFINMNEINKEININEKEKINNEKNIPNKKIKIVRIDLDNVQIENKNKKSINNDNKIDINTNINVDMVEQALQNLSKFNLDNTNDSF
jgi:hypothetical protein